MQELLIAYEPQIRLTAFLGIFFLVAGGEWLAPRRALQQSKAVRWFNNLTLVGLNTLLLRLVMPLMATELALQLATQGIGFFNQVAWPWWLELALAVAALDFAIYLQHVMVHAVPLLWRLHRMHHADLDYDVTTGARFHPLEILLSMGYKLAVVTLLGASLEAVILFEILLNGVAMFNHGNLRLPLGLDRVLRWFVVTPDFHRVHHSSQRIETNANFGFNLPFWDYLCGTYRPQPALGHEGMEIGLGVLRAPAELRLDRLLTQPFRQAADAYSIQGE